MTHNLEIDDVNFPEKFKMAAAVSLLTLAVGIVTVREIAEPAEIVTPEAPIISPIQSTER